MSRWSINKDEYPHQINVILDQYGVKSLKDLAKETRSESILESLVDDHWDTDTEICKYVAKNFATPLELLKRLAKHPAEEVRVAVASRKELDEKTALKLIFDTSLNVRQALARKCQYENVNKFLVQFNKGNAIVVSSVLLRPENKKLILEFIHSQNIEVINTLLSVSSLEEEYLKEILELQLKSNTGIHFIDKVFCHPNFSDELGKFFIENFGLKNLNTNEVEAIKLFVEK